MSFPFTSKLPEIGTTETDTLDFKCEIDEGTDGWKLAKDVAALANASGGTILVGACGGTTLAQYKKLTRDEALAAWKKYEEATRDRCSPPPSLGHLLFEVDDGFVLAIHVPPFPAPVAVRIRFESLKRPAGEDIDRDGIDVAQSTKGGGEDAWIFVRRVASRNVSFRPEELPMLMTPEIRRTAILLRSIGKESVSVVIRTEPEFSRERRYDGGWAPHRACTVHEIDELGNSVVFEPTPTSARFAVPLDRVVTVFRDERREWIVQVGYFHSGKA